MPFVNTNLGVLNLGFPDVCQVPTPVGPVPIPFPNIAISTMAIPSQFKVLIMCSPAHNMMTVTPISNGDNPGVAMGVVSGMVMGPQTALMGSTKVMIGGPPTTKMAMPTKQNGMSPNTVGMSLTPSQIRVMVLS